MTKTLYITYTGLMDPLGESQVLQYVLGLAAKGHEMAVLSFEKPDALADSAGIAAMQAKLKAAGIRWHRARYHRKPGMPATAFDIWLGIRKGSTIARSMGAEVVHCRSYPGSLMGLGVKRRTGARLIFDMRGFWPDERVDGGVWQREGMAYRVVKRLERKLFLGADHVVSLTRSGVREFEKFDYLQGRIPLSSVIPTCTNLELFRPRDDIPREGFTLGYVGSVGTWYIFEQVASIVARAFELREDARLLVINKGGHDRIRADLQAKGVDLSRVEIMASPYDEVGRNMARMDAGVFIIRAAWSKRASCPTRMGEFLACGKPCLVNGGVGDVAEDLSEIGTGIVLPSTADQHADLSGLDTALEQLFAMAADPATAPRARAGAEALFALEKGVEEYDRIYRGLSA